MLTAQVLTLQVLTAQLLTLQVLSTQFLTWHILTAQLLTKLLTAQVLTLQVLTAQLLPSWESQVLAAKLLTFMGNSGVGCTAFNLTGELYRSYLQVKLWCQLYRSLWTQYKTYKQHMVLLP